MPDENTKAIEQQIRINTRRIGPVATGVYAVAGEVVRIKLSDETMRYLRQHYTDPTKNLPFSVEINFNY
ncbi:UNVERIFIED_CONTAM: hypothetical protein O8I53_13855 [Campylobacter lari]